MNPFRLLPAWISKGEITGKDPGAWIEYMTLRATGRETEAVAEEDLAPQGVPAFTVCGNVISPFPDQACALYMAQKLEAVFARVDRLEDLLEQRPEELHAVCMQEHVHQRVHYALPDHAAGHHAAGSTGAPAEAGFHL